MTQFTPNNGLVDMIDQNYSLQALVEQHKRGIRQQAIDAHSEAVMDDFLQRSAAAEQERRNAERLEAVKDTLTPPPSDLPSFWSALRQPQSKTRQQKMADDQHAAALESLQSAIPGLVEGLGSAAVKDVLRSQLKGFPDENDPEIARLIDQLEQNPVDPPTPPANEALGENFLVTQREAMLAREDDPEKRAKLEAEIAELKADDAAAKQQVSDDGLGELNEKIAAYREKLASKRGEAPQPIYDPAQHFVLRALDGTARTALSGLEWADIAIGMIAEYAFGSDENLSPLPEIDRYRPMREAISAMKMGLEMLLPMDEARSRDFATDLANAAGSIVAFYALGAVTGGSKLALGSLGVAAQGASQYNDAAAMHAVAGQKFVAWAMGSGLGLTEMIPVSRAFNRMRMEYGSDVFTHILASSAANGFEEFLQEFTQAGGEDLIAKYGFFGFTQAYDADRSLSLADWLRSGGIGAITGAGAGLATSTAGLATRTPAITAQDLEALRNDKMAEAREANERINAVVKNIGGVERPANLMDGVAKITIPEGAPMVAAPIIQSVRAAAQSDAPAAYVTLQPEVAEKNLRLMETRRASREKGKPKWTPNPRVVIPSPGPGLPDVAIGDITFDDWIGKTETMLSPEEIVDASRWYADIRKSFIDNFGEDVGERFMVAWLAANQGVSPSQAVFDTLLQNDNIALDRQGADAKKARFPEAAQKARDVLMGLPISEKIGAKLADFIDAGIGNQTRQWVGGAESGGAPFPVDRHTGRDTGLVDQPYLDKLRERGYDIPDGIPLDYKNEINVAGPQYDDRADFGRALTEHLNDIGWQGRSDWLPSEVQAVGWMSTLKLTDSTAETPQTAIERNQFTTAFEIVPGEGTQMDGFVGARLRNLPPAAQARITKQHSDRVWKSIHEITHIPASTSVYTAKGGWEGVVNLSSTAGVIGSRDSVVAATAVTGYLLDQQAAISARLMPLKKSHKDLAITVTWPNEVSRATFEKAFDGLSRRGPKRADGTPLIQGFMPVVMPNGHEGFRILAGGGKKDMEALQDFVGFGKEEGAESPLEQALALSRYQTGGVAGDAVVTGADVIYIENDWAKGGQDYENAYREATGRDFPADIHAARRSAQIALLEDIAREEARAQRAGRRRLDVFAASAGDNPFAENGQLTLTHWSDEPRAVLDPAKAGTGPLYGGERRQGWKHVFLGAGVGQPGGYVKEELGPYRHEVTVPAGLIYNLADDVLNLRGQIGDPNAGSGSRVSQAVDALQKMGYMGYLNPAHPQGAVVGLFDAIRPDAAYDETTGDRQVIFSEPIVREEQIDAQTAYPVIYPVNEEGQRAFGFIGDPSSDPFGHWFGDSIVVDEEGLAKPVYHGTGYAGFNEFDIYGAGDGEGAWFSDDINTSKTYGHSERRVGDRDARRILENGLTFYREPDRRGDEFRFRRVKSETNSNELYELEVRSAEGWKVTASGGQDMWFRHQALQYVESSVAFMQNRAAGGDAGVYEVFLKIESPLVVDYEGRHWNDGPSPVQEEASTTYNVDIEGGWISRHDTLEAAEEAAWDASFTIAEEMADKAYFGHTLKYGSDPEWSPQGIAEVVADWWQNERADPQFDTWMREVLTGYRKNGNDERVVSTENIQETLQLLTYELTAKELITIPYVYETQDEPAPANTRDWVRHAQDVGGYDGVIFQNIVDTADGTQPDPATVYVVFEPTQIKSANANGGRYDPDNPDIYAMAAQPPSGLGSSAARASFAGEPTRPMEGVPTTAEKEGAEPISLRDISNQFVRLMDLTASQGRLVLKGKGIMGEYVRSQGTIHLRHWDDASTLFHEAGHFLHDRMDGPMRPLVRQHRDVIRKAAEELYQGDISPTNHQKMEREGFAELFRLFVQNRDMAMDFAPEWTMDMEKLLDAEVPGMNEGLRDIGVMFSTYASQTSANNLRSMVSSGTPPTEVSQAMEDLRENGAVHTSRLYFDKVLQKGVDRFIPLKNLVGKLVTHGSRDGEVLDLTAADDPAKIAQLMRNSGSRAMMSMTQGVVGYRSTEFSSRSLQDALYVSQGVEPGKELGRIDEKRQADFAAYLIARRAKDEVRRMLERKIERMPINSTPGDIDTTIAEMEEAYGSSFTDAAAIVDEYARALWQKQYDAGMISEETFRAGADRNFYAPLLRDMSDRGGALGAAFTSRAKGQDNLLRRFRGSDRKIIDPMQALIHKTLAVEEAIWHNDVKKALAKLADRAGTAGALVEHISAKDLKVKQLGLKEAAKQLTELDGVSEADAADLMTILQPAMDQNAYLRLFLQENTNPRGEPITFYWDRGELHALKINDHDTAIDVVNLIDGLGVEQSVLGGELLSMTSNVFRAGITSWPDFIAVNFIRDQVSAWLATDVGFKPFVSGLGGVKDELIQSKWAKSYNAMGGIMGGAGVAQFNEARISRDLAALRGKGYVAHVFEPGAVGAFKGFTKLTEVSETGTRLGLFKASYDRAKADGLSEYEAAFEAAHNATDYMDFGLHGDRVLFFRRTIPFLNAQVQGLYKMMRVIGAGEVARRVGRGNALKFMLQSYFKSTNNMPLTRLEQKAVVTGRKAWAKMVGVGMFSAAIALLFKDDEDYQEASEYLRTTGWIVPTGEGEMVYIPKPFEWAVVANAIERGIEAAYGDDMAGERFLRGLKQQLTLPVSNPAIKAYREYFYNYSGFRETAILPQWIEAESSIDPQLAVNAYTSQLAKDIGEITGWRPIWVDHFIKEMGASAARDIATLYEQARNPDAVAMDAVDTPMVRRFWRDSSRGSTAVADFWDIYRGEEGSLEGAYRAYKAWKAQGNPQRTNSLFEALSDEQRAYAILNEEFSAKDKRMHPMRRTADISRVTSQMRRELRSAAGLADTSTDDLAASIQLTAKQRSTLEKELSDYANAEARNTLILMGMPGWSHRQPRDLRLSLQAISAVHPDAAAELERRMAQGKVYDGTIVAELWPEVRERLLVDRADAILDDLVTIAKDY